MSDSELRRRRGRDAAELAHWQAERERFADAAFWALRNGVHTHGWAIMPPVSMVTLRRVLDHIKPRRPGETMREALMSALVRQGYGGGLDLVRHELRRPVMQYVGYV